MPQTRFVPGGRIVEEFIPDSPDEGYQGFSGDRPQIAFDMFGQLYTGDPKIELARKTAAQRHDEAEAQASAQARFDEPRFIPGMAEQPDSVEAIDRELFQPIRRQYGLPESDVKNNLRLFEIGNNIIQADPKTGTSRTVFTSPEKKLPEKAVKWQVSPDRGVLGNGETISLTPNQFVAALPTLPEFARTNAANIAQAKGWGYDLGSSGFTPPASTSSPRRVRVKGPGNQKGSVLEGTALPAGWSYE